MILIMVGVTIIVTAVFTVTVTVNMSLLIMENKILVLRDHLMKVVTRPMIFLKTLMEEKRVRAHEREDEDYEDAAGAQLR